MVTKFTEGAWAIVVILPLGVFALIQLHRQYSVEDFRLEAGAAQAAEAPILRRHVVVVFVDRLDMAVARAVQYARTLTPDDLRAVHFDLDSRATRELEDDWSRLGLSTLPLDIVECPDRRLGRASIELVADAVADGDTECTVLLPRRRYALSWRFLHDRTADKIAALAGRIPHVSATVIPYDVTERRVRSIFSRRPPKKAASAPGGPVPEAPSPHDEALALRAGSAQPIGEVVWRQRVRVAGRVRSVRVQPRAGTSNLECVLTDGSGAVLLVFQGRRRIPGIGPGTRLVAEGMVGSWGRRLAILNPDYELVAGPDADRAPGSG